VVSLVVVFIHVSYIILLSLAFLLSLSRGSLLFYIYVSVIGNG
jgi:hypothetical protein